jgi:hypothetical protein
MNAVPVKTFETKKHDLKRQRIMKKIIKNNERDASEELKH